MKSLFWMLLALATSGTGVLHAESFPGLHEPLKTVTEKYLVIQHLLATDKFEGVTAAATEMKTAVTNATAQIFEPDFLHAVTVLADARDLHTARVAFQEVSVDLIASLAHSQVQTGSLHSLFCPMRKTYWIQTDSRKVENPYYGSAMLDCGEFQRQF